MANPNNKTMPTATRRLVELLHGLLVITSPGDCFGRIAKAGGRVG
jgi:hypothetical protein